MENRKNKISFAIFIIILLIVGVGGYFATKYLSNTKGNTVSIFGGNTKEVDNRVDKTKDYVYYENITTVISDLNIEFKDIYINLNSGKIVSEGLNSEAKPYKDTIKYVKDVDIPDGTEYEENDEGVYSVTYRDYTEYDYENYISILIQDGSYNALEGTTPIGLKSYIFDKKQDVIVTSDELLQKYGTTIDKIKEKVKTKLTAQQETVDGEQLYNIDSTMSDFKYALTINKIGKLQVDYIVNSTKQSFYDNIVID